MRDTWIASAERGGADVPRWTCWAWHQWGCGWWGTSYNRRWSLLQRGDSCWRDGLKHNYNTTLTKHKRPLAQKSKRTARRFVVLRNGAINKKKHVGEEGSNGVRLWESHRKESKDELVHGNSGMRNKKKHKNENNKKRKGWKDYPGVIQSVYPIQESCFWLAVQGESRKRLQWLGWGQGSRAKDYAVTQGWGLRRTSSFLFARNHGGFWVA